MPTETRSLFWGAPSAVRQTACRTHRTRGGTAHCDNSTGHEIVGNQGSQLKGWAGASRCGDLLPALPMMRSRNVRCSGVAEEPVVENLGDDIPGSFEESASQACAALRAVLGENRRKGKKGRKGRPTSIRRLSVEVPAADIGPATSVSLASFIVNALEGLDILDANLVFTDEATVEVASSNLSSPSMSIATAIESQPRGSLVILAPGADQLAEVYTLVTEAWRGRLVILANAPWEGRVEDEYKSLMDSFDVVYSFVPLAVQGLLGRQDGAVMRWTKDKGSSTMWKIFVKRDDQFLCVGQQARRPSQQELELAMYNASAAESPITKGIKFFKGLAGK